MKKTEQRIDAVERSGRYFPVVVFSQGFASKDAAITYAGEHLVGRNLVQLLGIVIAIFGAASFMFYIFGNLFIAQGFFALIAMTFIFLLFIQWFTWRNKRELVCQDAEAS